MRGIQPLYTYKAWVFGQYVDVKRYPYMGSADTRKIKATGGYTIDPAHFESAPTKYSPAPRNHRKFDVTDVASTREAFKVW